MVSSLLPNFNPPWMAFWEISEHIDMVSSLLPNFNPPWMAFWEISEHIDMVSFLLQEIQEDVYGNVSVEIADLDKMFG